ncbi:YaaL family protein [Lacticigenium naphthae]|uniref:YaaL family protein n=1 Tax=Lacticigenium naphthae TaxID=515351 RepID=UPI0003FEC0F7|nr:YaaL family protein [Lacticigenium naphthae]
MGIRNLFRKKQTLQEIYDEKLLSLIRKKNKEWQRVSHLHDMSGSEHDWQDVELKLAKATYFYLYKEARQRGIKDYF